MPERALKNVAAKYHLTVEQATEILRLLDAGYGIPYVMRFHKELAGSLEPDGFYELVEERKHVEKLESRRRKILSKLEERDILADDVKEKIERARDMRELIDYYVPFRPRKRSRSRQAISQGLEPLARQVLLQEEFLPDMAVAAEPLVDAEKGVETVAAALEGVFHIVCDWVAEEKSHRDKQRIVFRQEAEIVVSRTGRSLPSRLAREFKQYFDFRQKAEKLHPYHMLGILRGKRLRALQYRFEAPLEAMERAAAELYFAGGVGQLEQIQAELGTEVPSDEGESLAKLNSTEFLAACIKHALTGILVDITAREMEKDLCNKAEDLALSIIQRNMRAMLMARPLKCRMLGIHPGYRTGCNLAALDEAGNVLATTTVYPHTPQNKTAQAKEIITNLVNEHGIAAVAIGEGTGVQETEALIAELIAEALPDLQYALVPEVSLQAHATSRAARSELPDVEPGERCAVALCRRLQDPLSELVKVNPRDLCPAPYADDVNGGALKKLLDRLIEECVCSVGVDANESGYSMMRYVCGLGPETAEEIVTHREQKGAFRSRQQIRDVPRIDEETWDRSVGFIRVAGSDNPLDRTRIHPRFYPVAEEICRQLEIAPADLASDEVRARLREQASSVKLTDLEKQFGVHYLLLKDILSELGDPWPDPREDGQAPVLRKKRLTMEDLEANQWFMGAVRNIVDFGVFVDLGIGEDGLVHISELSDDFVQSPYDVVSVGDVVRVRVVKVDPEKRRIALSMRAEDSRRERASRAPRRRREPTVRRRESHPSDVHVPDARPSSAVRAARSTLGMQSRRVERAKLAAERKAKQEAEAAAAGAAAAGAAAAGAQPASTGADAAPTDGPPQQPADLGGLLDKLGLGNIERRGKSKD